MKTLLFIFEMILLMVMMILVHSKADVRMVIETGVLYLAVIIRSTMEDE